MIVSLSLFLIYVFFLAVDLPELFGLFGDFKKNHSIIFSTEAAE